MSLSRIAAFAAVILTAAAVTAPVGAAPGGAALASGQAAVSARSEVKGVSLAAMDTLPRSPETGPLEDYCKPYREEKPSAVGRQVESLGWFVTGEAKMGRYQVVSFVSNFTPGTSMICYARNANLAVFERGRLVALAYARQGGPLANVEAIEGGAVMVWSDPPGGPVGELHAGQDGVTFTAVAASQAFCGGRVRVPSLYGKGLPAVHRILLAKGWRPRPPARRSEGGQARELARRGFPEAESCSGTGVNYCQFNYSGPGGLLHVTTSGEGYEDSPIVVVTYGMECRRR